MARPKKTKNLLQARKRKIFARRSWAVLRIFLILIFFAAALWGINYFYNSGYFDIESVDVQGNTHYSEEFIDGLLSGLIGNNIFEADKKETEDTLIEKLIWVRTVELKKVFPDRIEIILAERKPSLILVHRNNYYLIDGEGMVLEKLGKDLRKEYGDLLEVKGAIEHNLEPGDVVAKKNVLSCADIYMGFDESLKTIIEYAGIRDNISGDIYFTTDGGLEIVFGDSSQTVKKIEVLKLLLKEDTDYNIIDLKSPDNPVVKY
jgi:cell division protein FtsQ